MEQKDDLSKEPHSLLMHIIQKIYTQTIKYYLVGNQTNMGSVWGCMPLAGMERFQNLWRSRPHTWLQNENFFREHRDKHNTRIGKTLYRVIYRIYNIYKMYKETQTTVHGENKYFLRKIPLQELSMNQKFKNTSI